MSKLKKYWNSKTKALAWGLGAVLLVTVLIASVAVSNSDVCKKVLVNIKGKAQQYFITEKNVLTTINANGNVMRKAKDDINLKMLEEKLLNNIWVDKADIYFSDKNTLQIDVVQREPLYRLFTVSGNSFYVDKSNKVLPLSDVFNAKLPVFTGFTYAVKGTAADSALLSPVTKMAEYIYNNEFWSAQLQQIEIVKNGFELVPTVGNHLILFGDTVGMVNKFEKLKKYYNKVAAVIGFDRFKYLNVQFKNQVVGTNNYVNITDSLNIRRNVQNLLEAAGDTTVVESKTDTVQTRPRTNTATQRSTSTNTNINAATPAGGATTNRQAAPAIRTTATPQRTTRPAATTGNAAPRPRPPQPPAGARPRGAPPNNSRTTNRQNNNRNN